jgi:hypothetical protein
VPWIFVVGNREALSWVLTKQRMAFRDRVQTEGLRSGQPVAIYASRHTWGRPNNDRSQVAAIGVLASPVQRRPVELGGEIFPKSCRLTFDVVLPERHGLPFRPLVRRLNFIPKKGGDKGWGAYLRRTVVEVDERDFGIIASALRRYSPDGGSDSK